MDPTQSDALLTIISKVPYTELSKLCASNKQFAELCKTEQHYYLRFTNEYSHIKKAKHLSYEQIYKMCKRLENNQARMINVPETIFAWENINGINNPDLEDEDMELLNEKLLPYVIGLDVKRGDIIHLESDGDYRNDGKYIYDGEKIVQLDYDMDDYGAIPSNFKILDDNLTFSATYWVDVIAHNTYIYWDTKPYIDQLVRNFKPTKIVEENIRNHVYRTYLVETSFVHSTGVPFTIRFNILDEYTDEELIKYLSFGFFEVEQDVENKSFNPYILIFVIGEGIHLDKFI